jgi:hypothetical protein
MTTSSTRPTRKEFSTAPIAPPTDWTIQTRRPNTIDQRKLSTSTANRSVNTIVVRL